MFNGLSLENIGLFIWGVVASIGWIKKNITLKKEKKEVKILKEVVYDDKVAQIKRVYNLQRFSELEKSIKKVLYKTPIDRFTILFVMNGHTTFEFLTVLFDQKLGDHLIGGESPYVKVRIDSAYQNMIKDLEIDNHVFVDFSNEDFGRIGDYFRMEDIKCGLFSFVERRRLDKYNDMILFTTASSSIVNELSVQERNVIEILLTGKIIPRILETISNGN